MHRPTVLFVSYHFYPSNEIGARRPTALARYLVDKGFRVAVVSAFGGQVIEPGSAVLPGVVAVPVQKPSRTITDTLVRLKRKLSHPKTAPRLRGGQNPAAPSVEVTSAGFLALIRETYFQIVNFIDEYKGWGRRAYRAAVREGRKHPPTLVISSSPPPTVLWVGTLAARRLRVPHIADLRDPWTDMISTLHPNRPVELAMARKIEGWVMRSAAAITSTGSRVAHLLIQRQPDLASKTFVIRNGYDDAFRHRPANHGHAATAGLAASHDLYSQAKLRPNRDPFPLLHAVERLLSRRDVDATRVRVTFMGRKSEYAGKSFAEWLEGTRCAAVVRFLPQQSAELVAQATLESTVVLNLAQYQPLSVPAKTFEHLASGRENLIICEDDSESAQAVANIPGILQVDPKNSEALDQALLDLYERHVNQGRLRAPAQQDTNSCSRNWLQTGNLLAKMIKSIASVDAQRQTRGVDLLNPFRVGARAAGELARSWREQRQKKRLAPLYDPDSHDLDLTPGGIREDAQKLA